MNRTLRTPPFRGPGGAVLPQSIAESSYLVLGGLKQWVLIRGEDRTNPPLLLLHGGPGMSEMGFFRYYNAVLEKHFVCVNWDQRGAGKSFDPAIPKSSMNVEQFLSDLDELVEHVRRRLGAKQVVVLGHSWGGTLGALYVARHPEKVLVYVGAAQPGNGLKGDTASYEYGLAEAERQHNAKALKALRAVGPPPYDSEALMTERTWVARLEGAMKPRALLRHLRMAMSVPEGSVLDVTHAFRAMRWSTEAMWEELTKVDLHARVPKLDVPVFFFLGRQDHWVPWEGNREFIEGLEAPSKEVLWFEHSGHELFADEPEKFNDAMIRRVLPVVKARLAAAKGGVLLS